MEQIDLQDQATVMSLAKAITSHETAGPLPYEKSFDPFWKEAYLVVGVKMAFQIS